MFGITKNANAQKKREDGEKPFWISFSDLMSSLMVLFLISMTVALLAVTNEPDIAAKEEAERSQAIKDFMVEIEQILTAQEFSGVRVDGTTIDFGVRGTFEKEGQNTLSQQQSQMLRSFTPKLLEKLRTTDAGKIWFKRAVVEGYASKTGTYLFNLNLSLERSQRVLCELLREPTNATEKPFSEREAIQICRPRNKGELEAVHRILDDFFVRTSAGYVNKRALREIEKMHAKRLKAKESAETRWMRTHSERNANGMLTNNQYPITNNQKVSTLPSPPSVATFRKGGPQRVADLIKPFSEKDNG